MWLCMMCFMCCRGALSYCIVTSVDHKDPSKGTGDLEQHSCRASAARLMVLACWSIIGKVLSCISLMHDTGANSWVASVKLFCLALSPLRLSSTRRDYRLWFWKKNHIINPAGNRSTVYMLLRLPRHREGLISDVMTVLSLTQRHTFYMLNPW